MFRIKQLKSCLKFKIFVLVLPFSCHPRLQEKYAWKFKLTKNYLLSCSINYILSASTFWCFKYFFFLKKSINNFYLGKVINKDPLRTSKYNLKGVDTTLKVWMIINFWICSILTKKFTSALVIGFGLKSIWTQILCFWTF